MSGPVAVLGFFVLMLLVVSRLLRDERQQNDRHP
jgi:hypothetical protein